MQIAQQRLRNVVKAWQVYWWWFRKPMDLGLV